METLKIVLFKVQMLLNNAQTFEAIIWLFMTWAIIIAFAIFCILLIYNTEKMILAQNKD